MIASYLRVAVVPLALLIAQTSSERARFTVWAVHDGVKVKRDDLAHPERQRNAIWDGRTIRLLAARNEVVAFQVIVAAGASAIDDLRASLPALQRRGGGEIRYQPPAADPTDYRNRSIQIFSQHYMRVERASRATWVFKPESPTAPKDALGWIPVQLVPENARPGRGGFPLRVEARRNQGFWFDIYVSRTAAAGSYRGTVAIAARSERRAIPIELQVLDVQLPDENTLPAMVYYQGNQPELYHGRNLDPAYHRFAKRNRVEFVHAYNPATARTALDRLTGRDFTRERGYEGPGEGVPNRIVPRTFYGPGADFAASDNVWKSADEWMEFLERHVPHALTFLYMPDEPRPPQFPDIVALGHRLKSNPGKGRTLRTFVTRGYVGELAPAIDIWCAGPLHYDIERAKLEQNGGKSYWFYNGGRPAAGAIVIDSPATDARVVGWAAFKHGADGYFYWHGVHWRHNSQKKIGDRNQDVWANAITFDNRTEANADNGFINGDGVLVYPGEEKLHPEQDRSIAGPVSTIQMANLRRGLQDHALLTLARRAGLEQEIAAAMNRLVPRVFSDAVATEVGFSERGNDYEDARQRLLRALAQVSNGTASSRRNVVMLVIDDTRWDSIGAAGNPIVRTPRLDALSAEGIRFTQARVATSICMTSRASLLTGQYMSRHGIDRFGKQLTPEAFALTYAGVLRSAGYWTGYVGKYDVGAPRPADFDFLRAYHGRHWIEGADGERVHVTEKNARDAIEFLRTRPRDKPFLLSVGFFAAHAEDSAKQQYLPQDWSAALYKGVKVPPSPLGDRKYLEALPPFLSADSNEGRVRFRWRFDTPARYQEYMVRYYRLITEVDAAVGRLIDELKTQGVYENTVIVFTGDNGYFHGDRGLADKWYPYEQALRVPLIVRDPRLPLQQRGSTRDQLVLNIDLAPTLIVAAGLPVPSAIQGEDISALYLRDTLPRWRDEFFYEHPTITSRDRIPASQGVIRRDWKYVYWPEFEYEQLFDLKRDPDEIRNVAGQPAHADELARMRRSLEEWRRRAR